MTRNKRILIFDREDSQKYPGGDTVQMNEIGKFLESKNYEVTITSDLTINVLDYDLIIIFNLQLPYQAYCQAKIAVASNKPYVFFPVYWDLDSIKMDDVISIKSFSKYILTPKIRDYLKTYYLRKKENVWLFDQKIPHRREMMLYIIRNAKLICPNSYAELDHLILGFPNEDIINKSSVIYNGININKLNYSETVDFNSIHLAQDYICCVGAIGPRKNQLNLVKAANLLGINLVVIGSSTGRNQRYNQYIRKIAGKNITFIDYCKQEQVFSILKNSLGHIQPSYIETPGLVSLEAIALGKKIVVSDVEPVKEYFGDKAFYVNPNNFKSIANGISKMLNASTEDYSQYFRKKFNWESVLIKLIDEIELMFSEKR